MRATFFSLILYSFVAKRFGVSRSCNLPSCSYQSSNNYAILLRQFLFRWIMYFTCHTVEIHYLSFLKITIT